MQHDELLKFEEFIENYSHTFERKITQGMIQIYFDNLREYPFEVIRKAFAIWCRSNMKFPKIPEVVKLIEKLGLNVVYERLPSNFKRDYAELNARYTAMLAEVANARGDERSQRYDELQRLRAELADMDVKLSRQPPAAPTLAEQERTYDPVLAKANIEKIKAMLSKIGSKTPKIVNPGPATEFDPPNQCDTKGVNISSAYNANLEVDADWQSFLAEYG